MTVQGTQPNQPFTLDYLEHNMEYTQDLYMRATADKISFLIYSIPLALVAPMELIGKNGLFLLYNAVVLCINTASYLVDRVMEVMKSCFASLEEDYFPEIFGTNKIIFGHGFSCDDLAAFRAALQLATDENKPAIIYLENLIYAVWYDANSQTVKIQDRNQEPHSTLSLRITDAGQITQLKLNEINQESFPDTFVLCMWPCFQKALEVSSEYVGEANQINIQVIQRGLNEIPEYHLEALGNKLLIERRGVPDFHVVFLKNDLSQNRGIDAGGLSRDYVDDLFGALIRNKQELRFKEENDLFMPITVEEYRADEPDRLPRLFEIERSLFEKMGTAMMFFYLANNGLSVGRRFQDALFAAALCLTPQEADTPFQNLTMETKLKMSEAIFRAQDKNLRIIQLLRRGELTEAEWQEAAAIVEVGAILPEDFAFEFGNQNHHRIIKEGLQKILFNLVGQHIAPCHAIAKGMVEMRRRVRENLNPIAYRDFSDRIQGRIKRDFIAQRIVVAAGANLEVQKKARWIREWIESEDASDGDVRNFIKFATGSSSLLEGQTISIREQLGDQSLVPEAHTCFLAIDLATRPCEYAGFNDHTKEEFIRMLKELALTHIGGYTMG